MKHIALTLLALVFFTCSYAQPAAIVGPSTMCDGMTANYTDATPGGTWTSSNPTVATINTTTGIATGVSSGVTTISYTIPGPAYATKSVTVNAAVPPIGGSSGVCVGLSTALTDATGGGTWSSANPAIATVGMGTGVVTGITAGSTTITYALPTGCYTTHAMTVYAAPSAITGTTNICAGGTTTLSATPAGGIWSSGVVMVATVGSGSGIVTGVAAGVSPISYTVVGGCATSVNVTVNAQPAAFSVTGGGSYCSGGTGVPVGLGSSAAGISYQLYLGVSPVGSPVAGTGAAISFGSMTSAGTYTVVATNITTGCSANMTGSATVTINPLPTAYTVNAGNVCSGAGPGKHVLLGNSDMGVDYQLYSGILAVGGPISGTGTALDFGPQMAGTYTVVGTDGMTVCVNNMSGSAVITGNMISGYITYSGTPSDSLKVWLIQFNPSDSTITAQDSTYACMATSSPYYQFDDKTAGNYLVKVRLMGTIPGTSGYIPTYGLSTPHWDSASTIVHGSGADTMHINMIYGTIPSGPGFIGGYVVMGAGKGTSGEVPAPGLLVYLKDATGHILTYTYTDVTGAYSFSGIANGDYIVCPVDYKYYTTPSPVITLSTTMETITGVSFKKHTTLGTITPFVIITATPVNPTSGVYAYPNPTNGSLNIKWTNQAIGDAHVTITDVTGREVYNTIVTMNAISGTKQLDITTLKSGIYFMNIRSAHFNSSSKLVVQE